MSYYKTKAGNQEQSLNLTLSFTHSRHAEQLLFYVRLCSKVTLSLSFTLSHSFNISLRKLPGARSAPDEACINILFNLIK